MTPEDLGPASPPTPAQPVRVDVAIVGSGFAGSLLARALRTRGRSVALLERQQHPRFVIGESSTPLTGLLLEKFAHRWSLPDVHSLSKYGTWRTQFPQIACGLKRGFTFYHHRWNEPFQPRPSHSRELLVAASPHDAIADTHWYRPEFDAHLARLASIEGALYLDRFDVNSFAATPDAAILRGSRDGQPVEIRADWVVDASGGRGFLRSLTPCSETAHPDLPETCGLFTHFVGVRRLEDVGFAHGDSTLPYPVDDAAVHHLFPGGWIWVLRFNNGITSAGVVATRSVAESLSFSEGSPAWDRLLRQLPSVARQFELARPTRPFIYSPKVSFAADRVFGPRWILTPAAAGFVDPLLSTGFPLSLLGVHRLAELLASTLQPTPEQLETYAHATRTELAFAARLVASLYKALAEPDDFRALALLYFGAASFCEVSMRLGRDLEPEGFLRSHNPRFAQPVLACLREHLDGRLRGDELADRTRAILEPIDVGGWTRADRLNWYPASSADLLASAHRLECSPNDLNQLLIRSGFYPAVSNGHRHVP